MRVKSGFIVRETAGSWVAVPTGYRAAEIDGVIALSETGAFLWERLSIDRTVEQLVWALLQEYEVDAARAKADVQAYVTDLRRKGLLVD